MVLPSFEGVVSITVLVFKEVILVKTILLRSFKYNFTGTPPQNSFESGLDIIHIDIGISR